MKRKNRAAALLAAAMLLLSGCAFGAKSSPETTQAAQSFAASAENIDIEFSARDLEADYDESAATRIALADGGTQIDGQGATVAGDTVTISAEGTYLLAGSLSNGQIIVSGSKSDKVQLVLDGVTIHCETNAAINVLEADKVFITLAANSQNALSGGERYAQLSDDASVDAVIFSKADLTLNGSGNLTVEANYKHGIVSKDDLVVTGGTYAITSASAALEGKDCVKIAGGAFAIEAGTDAIRSDNDEDAARGYVYVAGGSFQLSAGNDAIQAQTVLRVDGGSFDIQTGGGSDNASTKQGGEANQNWGQWGRAGGRSGATGATGAAGATGATGAAEGSGESAKGLKAGTLLVLNGGAFTIDSSDDALHANGDLTVKGGTLSIRSGDDGMHADGALTVSDGEISIAKSYEGIEGMSIAIEGGVVDVVAGDDGLNAAGGADQSSMNGRMGQNRFAASGECYILISGGSLTVNASGDGVDSNGNLSVTGGTTLVSGPTDGGNGALDYGEGAAATITGGVFVAAGSAGMAEGFSSASGQCSILYTWNSSLSAGTAITLTDASGTLMLSYAPEKSFQSVVVSAPELALGETYTLAAGSQSAQLTLSSPVTSNGRSGGFGRGW